MALPDFYAPYIQANYPDEPVGARLGGAIAPTGSGLAGVISEQEPVGGMLAGRVQQDPMLPFLHSARSFFDGLHADTAMQGVRRDNMTNYIASLRDQGDAAP